MESFKAAWLWMWAFERLSLNERPYPAGVKVKFNQEDTEERYFFRGKWVEPSFAAMFDDVPTITIEDMLNRLPSDN